MFIDFQNYHNLFVKQYQELFILEEFQRCEQMAEHANKLILIIIVLIPLYFIVLLIIGWITGKKATNEAFFIGERKSPWYIVSFGMIGASLSGVTFISVPGWVMDTGYSYMQMVLGYLFGYAIIAFVLMPLYYRLRLTSIYTYLYTRFGDVTYKTGSLIFLVSRIVGASLRLFIVAKVLQLALFDILNIPFYITVVATILFIWIYTFKGGIKTIIWTDTLQTFFMLAAVVITLIVLFNKLDFNLGGFLDEIKHTHCGKMFFFGDYKVKNYFFKQFLSGILISVVMTGLDQDMMQKNLSCRNLKEAQKNILSYSVAFVPVNLIFLTLGVLLVLYANKIGMALPEDSDELFPLLATEGGLPLVIGIMFMLGLIAAAYSSADSALTSLTTVFTIDILRADRYTEEKTKKIRMLSHILMSVLLLVAILLFRKYSNDNVVNILFTAAAYTYGPLLGLFFFGLFIKRDVKDKLVPLIAIIAPVTCFILIKNTTKIIEGYAYGYEFLLINGLLTVIGLLIISKKRN